MKLVKQLFGIEKNDWMVAIKTPLRTRCFYTLNKKQAMKYAGFASPTNKVQIYKLSYELKEAFVVPEKPVKKGKKSTKGKRK